MKRIGHSGTLDPMATGVLPVFLEMLRGLVICFLIIVKLILRALSWVALRILKIVLEQLTSSEIMVSKDEFIEVMHGFIGEIQQIPPMFSAVSINGKRLYELARKE